MNRICIVMMSAVGDAVHVLPVINAIKRQHPDSHITWVLQAGAASLVRGHPSIDEIIIFDRKNGIKGFIFGERGVWRPGDSLFLSCIIEDKDNKLPEEHPVEMELYSPTGQLYKRPVQSNATGCHSIISKLAISAQLPDIYTT